MRRARWGTISLAAFVLAVAAAAFGAWLFFRSSGDHTPRCVAGATAGVRQGDPSNFQLSPAQAINAATIAGVAAKLDMPDHGVTVALATALQESGLRNLRSGDRDSIGLFQQRPSQGWGTREQISDPVYATTKFYQKLRTVAGWQRMSVTAAAQAVQRSAAPDAYAEWEPEARALAAALTGEHPSAFTCRNLAVGPPRVSLADVASHELGTAKLSGTHDSARGWAIGSWLVANAVRFGVDKVTFDGQTWTAESGVWTRTGPPNGLLSLHQLPVTAK